MDRYLNNILLDYKKKKSNYKYTEYIAELLKDNLHLSNKPLIIRNSIPINKFKDNKYVQKVYLNLENFASIDEYSITWNYGFNKIPQEVTSNKPIKNIIGFKIYPFRSVIINNNLSILVKEFVQQSYINHKENKFHFDFYNLKKVLVSNNLFHPINNGYYWFNSSIDMVNTLTLEFSRTGEKILIDELIPTYYNDVKTFALGRTTYISNVIKSNPGEIEFGGLLDPIQPPGEDTKALITGFTTTEPIIDKKIIEKVNAEFGTYIGGRIASPTESYTLTGIDLTQLVGDPIIDNMTFRELSTSLNIQLDFICDE